MIRQLLFGRSTKHNGPIGLLKLRNVCTERSKTVTTIVTLDSKKVITNIDAFHYIVLCNKEENDLFSLSYVNKICIFIPKIKRIACIRHAVSKRNFLIRETPLVPHGNNRYFLKLREDVSRVLSRNWHYRFLLGDGDLYRD